MLGNHARIVLWYCRDGSAWRSGDKTLIVLCILYLYTRVLCHIWVHLLIDSCVCVCVCAFTCSVANGSRAPYLCRKCRVHGKRIRSKQHKRTCPFAYCNCAKCCAVQKSRQVVARQIAMYRDQQTSGMGDVNLDGRRAPSKEESSKVHKENCLADGAAAEEEEVPPRCRKCRNHGIKSEWKGHKKVCPYRNCCCAGCFLIVERKRSEKALRDLALVLDELSDDGKRQNELPEWSLLEIQNHILQKHQRLQDEQQDFNTLLPETTRTLSLQPSLGAAHTSLDSATRRLSHTNMLSYGEKAQDAAYTCKYSTRADTYWIHDGDADYWIPLNRFDWRISTRQLYM